MATSRSARPARGHAWGTIRVRTSLYIRARPTRLAALYLDYEGWPRLFPATIRSVRRLDSLDNAITVEVDHRTEGHVVNIIHPRSATVIALEEFKPKFDAAFINRFDRVPGGTRYTVDAQVRFHMPWALLAPVLGGIVRRRVRRFVLEPMRAAADREAPRPTSRRPRVVTRPERPRVRKR